MRFWTAISMCALAAVVGCAAIIGIPDRSLSFCNKPENTHAFCDDFDHADAAGQWSLGAVIPPDLASLTVSPDSKSAPYSIAFGVQPLGGDAAAIAGLLRDFPGQAFTHMHIEFDIKLPASLQAAQAGGFLLIEDKPGLCLQFGLGRDLQGHDVGIGVAYYAATIQCGGGLNSGDGGVAPPIGGGILVPPQDMVTLVDQWVHWTIDVTRNAKDGSGMLAVNIPITSLGAPSPIPPNTMPGPPQGVPAIGIAGALIGPSGEEVDILFDNVTIDFLDQ